MLKKVISIADIIKGKIAYLGSTLRISTEKPELTQYTQAKEIFQQLKQDGLLAPQNSNILAEILVQLVYNSDSSYEQDIKNTLKEFFVLQKIIQPDTILSDNTETCALFNNIKINCLDLKGNQIIQNSILIFFRNLFKEVNKLFPIKTTFPSEITNLSLENLITRMNKDRTEIPEKKGLFGKPKKTVTISADYLDLVLAALVNTFGLTKTDIDTKVIDIEKAALTAFPNMSFAVLTRLIQDLVLFGLTSTTTATIPV